MKTLWTSWIVLLTSYLLVVFAEPIPVHFDARQSQPKYDCTGVAVIKPDSAYVCGDWRLGPTTLPTNIQYGNPNVADLLNPSKRFGDLSPAAFLAKWWNTTGKGFWNYPVRDGYQLTINNTPIKGEITLRPGFKIDRFGEPTGRFAGPWGAPYVQRSLPPSSLNTASSNTSSSPKYPYNYHVYEVKLPITVTSGPIAAAFEQAGQGVQYQFADTLGTLVIQGKLKEL